MPKTLIICEKPTSAAKIAAALAGKRLNARMLRGAPFYEFERDGKTITVVSALGHLFVLKNLGPIKSYPFYDVGWVPIYKVDRKAKNTRAFIEAIQELAKGATDYISACDFDIEGSVIAANILRYICGEEALVRAKRMRFSTLTAEDLRRAHEQLMPQLDFERIDAGIARHFLDWFWGMNVLLAMSSAVKVAEQRFARLSAGRVQTPTLKILAEREREIASFNPEPFWFLRLVLAFGRSEIVAEHSVGKLWEKSGAEEALAACRNKPAKVSSIHTHKYERPPPVPFDLGLLQSEAYRCFGLAPLQTQQIAQELYQAALISYPRTDSQKLPPSIGYAKIIERLGGISAQYREFSYELLKSPELRPNEGGKADPAHPAIFPTGDRPTALTGPQRKVFDLIVRRFFSVFGKPALVESTKVEIDVGGQIFHISGQKIFDEGWMRFYGSYISAKDIPLPELFEGQELPVKSVTLGSGETKPPPRYNQASILKEMEVKRLGTKGTRAPILQNLYKRGYIFGSQISVTDIGLEVVNSLLEYCPEIVSDEMTTRFESELEAVQGGKRDKDELISEARVEIDRILGNFRQHELEIGQRLAEAYRMARMKQSILGKCKCGGDMKVVRSRATRKRFAGCSNYPACKNSFPLPQFGDIVSRGKVCEYCQTPTIQVNRAGQRPYRICLDPECQTKVPRKEMDNK